MELQQQNTSSPMNKSFGFAVGMLGLGFTGMLLISYFVYLAITGIFAALGLWMTADFAVLLNDICIYCLGLPFLLIIGHFIPNGASMPFRPKKTLHPGGFAKFACIGYAGLYLSSLVTSVLLTIANLFSGKSAGNSVGEVLNSLSPVTAFLLVAVLPAIMEELVFRAYLYKKLIRFGELPYILLSGVFFAAYHANFEQVLYAFVLGCWMAYMLCRTGTVVYGMMLHLLINFYSSNVINEVVSSGFASTLLMVVSIVLTILGCIFFANIRKTLYVRPSVTLPPNPVMRYFANPGTILWLGTFLGMAVVTYLFN